MYDFSLFAKPRNNNYQSDSLNLISLWPEFTEFIGKQ